VSWVKRRPGVGITFCSTLVAIFLIAGCAVNTPTGGRFGSQTAAEQADSAWSGRIALTLSPADVTADKQSTPIAFFASFDLAGNSDTGELTLQTPLGSTLAQVRWTATTASLRSAQGLRRYPSLDALTADLLGTPVPVAVLFAWLAGQPEAVAGWQVDLSGLAQGKLQAQRTSPEPPAQLRITLDKP
jgi:outer membrane lipoprotein LolB